ncbi:hypothetical protein [Streptomyces sp. Root369]|uniref:hypothetical protein n=1 Tax=Streptomyces sp. Root369 TaxID=1736523 RepID=UPI0013019419|nr:hypothetical protein [Streptomyces sp. Root369]
MTVVVPVPACAAGGWAPQPATFRAWPVCLPDRPRAAARDRGGPGAGVCRGRLGPVAATLRAWPVCPPDRGAPGCGARDAVVVPAPVYAAGGWAP